MLGKCALVNLAVGDYILPSKVGNDLNNAQSILGFLDSEHKAISISIASYALGFSGKLETGDIISILDYDEVENLTYTPKELNYVKVITASNGHKFIFGIWSVRF